VLPEDTMRNIQYYAGTEYENKYISNWRQQTGHTVPSGDEGARLQGNYFDAHRKGKLKLFNPLELVPGTFSYLLELLSFVLFQSVGCRYNGPDRF
jgi:hypothetical protein